MSPCTRYFQSPPHHRNATGTMVADSDSIVSFSMSEGDKSQRGLHFHRVSSSPASSNSSDDQNETSVDGEELATIDGANSPVPEVKNMLMLSLRLRSRAEEWQVDPKELKLHNVLGSGDCAIVYKARWRGMDIVAKQLKTKEEYRSNGSTISAADARDGLMNEISILSHLRHPNLVLFLGACTEAGKLILLSEFMDGGNLEEYVSIHRKVRFKHVLAWSQDLGQALCFLHNCSPKIIHRDLKPANLLLTQGRLKVADFGLSSAHHSMSGAQDGYVMTGLTGTLRYMAPEVLNVDRNGKSEYNETVDIYSTGMIMWYMAMGERPFGDLACELVTVGTCKGLRPDLSSIQSQKGAVGSMLASIIEKCWAAQPQDRCSAQQLVRAVREARILLAKKGRLKKTMRKVKEMGHRFSSAAASAMRMLSFNSPEPPVAERDRHHHPRSASF